MNTTPPPHTLAFIGGGNMAEALLRGLLQQDRVSAAQLRVTDIDATRRAYLEATYHIQTDADNGVAIRWATHVVLAVKPQQLIPLLQSVREAWRSDQVVISIAAGIPTARIEAELPTDVRVVRCMPNTPALVGQGVHAIALGSRATTADSEQVADWLAATGKVVSLAEAQMDAVTAISGSGPAYVFYLMEAMEAAAAELGLAPDCARELITATVAGTAALWQGQPDETPATLRQRVTSKGGTTAAAMAVLEHAAVRTHWIAAIRAAEQRARELAQSV